MIRITKPAEGPAILRNRGRTTTEALCEMFDAEPAAYIDGTKKFSFDSKLYGAKSVKKALLKAQSDKCCFCESKVTHIAYGDVEHFRPKGGYRQSSDDPLGKPGYYWLAYEWSNLFFACQLCNQRFKKNLFPLSDTTKRAISHNDDLNTEEIVFIHPEATDPAEHVGYRSEYCRPVDGSERGTATIEALGLNREELVEVRRDRLATWRHLVNFREVLTERIEQFEMAGEPVPQDVMRGQQELDAHIRALQLDAAEYAAMARAFFNSTG